MTPWGAIRMLARHELRSRWRSVVLLGVASGIFFGGALTTIAVLLRADTAYDRMVSATDLADARVGTYNIFNDVNQKADVLRDLSVIRGRILARPDVVDSQQLSAVYARVDTKSLQYMGIWAPRHQWDGLDTPIVVDGRMPAEGRADEVMVNEEYARAHNLSIGDRIGVDIYRSEQVRDFGNGLPTPAGGRIELLVVGVYRVADAGTGFAGVLAGPAFAARFDATAATGEILLLKLDPALQSPVFGSVQLQAITLDGQMASRYGTGFYNYVDYVEPRANPDPAIGPTLVVLQSGLGILAGVVAAGGVVLTLQLAGRWSSLGRADNGVERALGMRARDQIASRVLAALPAVALAVGISVLGAQLGGFFEPPGALNRFEPHPGWRGQPWTTAVGAVVVLLVVVGLVVATSAAVLRAAMPERESRVRRARVPRGAPLVPVLRLAVALGAERGGPRRAVRLRATLVGLTVIVAMMVIVVSLGSRLTGVVSSPAQWGWTADFGISGDSLELDGRMLADPRVRDADEVIDAPVHVMSRGGLDRMSAYGVATVKGTLPYRIVTGHEPEIDEEVAVGPRAAEELGVGVGDKITFIDAVGEQITKTVCGIAVLPTLEDEPLGRNLLMTKNALRGTAVSQGYSNLLVRAVSAQAAASLRTELAPTNEIVYPSAPITIVALGKLDAPARLLVIVLLVGGVLLVAEYVTLLLRRRGAQLAIASSIGMTRRQLISAISASTILTALTATLLGAPTGWAISRVVLVEIGPRLGIALAGPAASSTLMIGAVAVAGASALAVALSVVGLRRKRRPVLSAGDTG